MRRQWNCLFFLILFLITPVFAAEDYTLDPKHTYALWYINHFGFSNPSGKWMAEGHLILDENNLSKSKVDVTIHTNEIATGLAELDKHLKGSLFFDVVKFPTATFVSNKIDTTGKNTIDVQGTLTVHGVSKPIVLHAKLNKIGENPISNKKSVGFSATAQLKRSDFGINTLLPGLGDDVSLEIEVEAFK